LDFPPFIPKGENNNIREILLILSDKKASTETSGRINMIDMIVFLPFPMKGKNLSLSSRKRPSQAYESKRNRIQERQCKQPGSDFRRRRIALSRFHQETEKTKNNLVYPVNPV
jgi:hypothetical protein